MFYENVKELCRERQTNITQVAKDIGMSTAAPASWKKGSIPKGETLQKIADYFSVSVDYLLRDESTLPNVSNNISNSAVIQGNTTGNVNISNGIPISESMNEQEQELLRIFRGLTFRSKTKLMSLAFQVEDEDKMQ